LYLQENFAGENMFPTNMYAYQSIANERHEEAKRIIEHDRLAKMIPKELRIQTPYERFLVVAGDWLIRFGERLQSVDPAAGNSRRECATC
jgi:hypothetical protein